MDSRASRSRKINLLLLAGIVGTACTVLFAQGSEQEMAAAPKAAQQAVIQIHANVLPAADVQQETSARLPRKHAENDFGYYRFHF